MFNAFITEFSQHLSPIIPSLGTAHFWPALMRLIRWRLYCDSVVMLLYRKDAPPKILFDDMDSLDRQAMQGAYFKGTYLLSPFYLHWLTYQKATLVRLVDIAPEGFFDSVYYADYYACSGLIDEAAFLVPAADESGVLFSLGRTRASSVFTKQELDYLVALQDIIFAIVREHLTRYELPPREGIKSWLADGLRLFGSSVLTEREQDVVQMMLRGYSSKSCAKVLGISFTTERVHRRNIYLKLGISSQAELFSLFFAAMSQEHLQAAKDPFQSYSPHLNTS